MICTNNPCLVFLLWSLILIVSPLIIVLLFISWIIHQIYNTLTCQLSCCRKSMKQEFGDRFDTTAKHYNHKYRIFQNYWDSHTALKWYEGMLTFLVDLSPQKKPDYECTDKAVKDALEYETIHWNKINSFHDNNSENKGKIQYLWFGHSSCLIQMDGFNILTDPIFSDRCSALQFVGPKRYDNISKYRDDIYESLPIIDVVVISHDHYDHLDYNTINILNNTNRVKYFAVPLRIRSWLIKNCNVSPNKIIELDWYYSAIINQKSINCKQLQIQRESINPNEYYQRSPPNNAQSEESKSCDELLEDYNDDDNKETNGLKEDELKIICVPTQHFSGRTLYDRCYRLWCGWVIISSSNKKIYFGGDTGCCSVPRKDNMLHDDCDELKCNPVFGELGDKYGPFDLGLIPIGAYSPRWFMSRIHLNPYDACFVHKKLRSKKSIGIHWGSFYLTDEDYDEPPKVLSVAMKKYDIRADDFFVVRHGAITCI